jgi:hypothetical protein
MEQAIVQPEQQAPQVVNDYDIDSFIEKRTEFIEKVNRIMVEGKDFHIIQGRKSMAKGGAEKIASIFGWTATFTKDQDATEAFSTLKDAGIICFICNLEKAGQQVGQGRGAAALAKNGGDPNKTLKMAQKSAFIDAVIRASGLSDFYTQDLEDMEPGVVSNYPQTKNSQPGASSGTIGAVKPSQKQYDLIASLMEQKGITKEDLIDAGFVPGTLTGGKDGTASQMIDYLFKAKSKVKPNGDPVEELPTIEVESLEEMSERIDL